MQTENSFVQTENGTEQTEPAHHVSEADLVICYDADQDDSLTDIEKSCSIERLIVPGGASVYVVGTAHVSSKSCDDVQEIIRRLKPQVTSYARCKK